MLPLLQIIALRYSMAFQCALFSASDYQGSSLFDAPSVDLARGVPVPVFPTTLSPPELSCFTRRPGAAGELTMGTT